VCVCVCVLVSSPFRINVMHGRELFKISVYLLSLKCTCLDVSAKLMN
jgi:hypothetical protein